MLLMLVVEKMCGGVLGAGRMLKNGMLECSVCHSKLLSPSDVRDIDVRAKDKASGSIAVSVEEDFQQWRLVFLGLGFILLLSALVVSNWAPFYYSSSMTLGVMLVVLLILFQGMKPLPVGRKKNTSYLTLYGSLLGVGSFVAHYFSTVINSILANFGLSEAMHNIVSVFLLVGIILAGAALGFWIVRKFVLSRDGSVDAGIAQFVKWAMRILAIVFVFQSTLDSLLSVDALVSCWSINFLVTSRSWRRQQKFCYGILWSCFHGNGIYQQGNYRQPFLFFGFECVPIGVLYLLVFRHRVCANWSIISPCSSASSACRLSSFTDLEADDALARTSRMHTLYCDLLGLL